MIRNRELWLFTLAMLGVSALISAAIYQWAPQAAAAALCGFLLLTALSLIFTRRRYRQIAQLNDYLQQAASGDFSLDIRTHQEGELSLLRTEIYKVVLRLSEQKDQMERERQALADAISNISHQLKTPITSMVVMTDLLREEGLEAEKRQQFTRSIHTQLQRIEWLVSSLLKLAKLDAGVVRFQRRQERAESLIQEALAPIQIPLELKNIQTEIRGDADALLLCDRQWTVEALVNILKNCMEHTPAGGRIQAEIKDTALYTQVVILDSGPGVSRQDLPYIFNRFYRGKNAGEGSVGIGLAMARSFLEGQNADLTAATGPGGHFVIRFYKQMAI